MEWANSGELLAVAGMSMESSTGNASNGSSGPNFINMLHFYNENGVRRFVIPIPCTQVLHNTYLICNFNFLMSVMHAFHKNLQTFTFYLHIVLASYSHATLVIASFNGKMATRHQKCSAGILSVFDRPQ